MKFKTLQKVYSVVIVVLILIVCVMALVMISWYQKDLSQKTVQKTIPLNGEITKAEAEQLALTEFKKITLINWVGPNATPELYNYIEDASYVLYSLKKDSIWVVYVAFLPEGAFADEKVSIEVNVYSRDNIRIPLY